MKKGIDISYHNRSVNLDVAKAAGIDFVIIRMGFGDNAASQDDKQFLMNVNKARAAGMRWGLYLYSYAQNMDQVESEVQHSVRLVQKVGRPPLGIWWDSEDASTSHCNLRQFFTYYKNNVEALTGYPVGMYSYKAFYEKNYQPFMTEREYPFWFARYNNKLPGEYYKNFCDIWQYSSDEFVPGIGKCDVNRMHRRSITAVLQVWRGLYGDNTERRRNLELAGYNYSEVQKFVNEYGKAADDVINNKYGTGADRVNRLKAAGYNAYIVQQIVNIKIMG